MQTRSTDHFWDKVLQTEPVWATLVYLFTFYLPSLDAGWNILGVIGLIVLAGSWALRRWRKGYCTRSTAFTLPLAIFLISAVVGLLASRFPDSSLARLWVLIGGYALFDVMAYHSSEKVLKGYWLVILGGGLLVLLMLLTQIHSLADYPRQGRLLEPLAPVLVFLSSLQKFWPKNAPFLTIGRNSINVSIMVLLPMLWPLTNVSIRQSVRIALTILEAILIITLLMVTVASGGASALVALTLSGILISLLLGRIFLALGTSIATALTTIVLFSSNLGHEIMLYLLSNINIRLDLWQSALYAIHDFPLTGLGLGLDNWFSVLPTYAMPNLGIYYDEPGEFILMHAHNYYLQTWLEQGVLGFVSLVAIVIIGLYIGVRTIRATTGFQKSVAIAALWSFCAFMLHSLFDAGPSAPGILILWLVLGLMEVTSMLGSAHHTRATLPGADLRGQIMLISGLLTMAAATWIPQHPALGIIVGILAGLALGFASIGRYQKQKAVR